MNLNQVADPVEEISHMVLICVDDITGLLFIWHIESKTVLEFYRFALAATANCAEDAKTNMVSMKSTSDKKL